mgnify:CR=1 FL=1
MAKTCQFSLPEPPPCWNSVCSLPGAGDALAGVKAKYAGNAKVMAALAECERDPSAVLKFMSDPELSAVAQDIMRSIGAGGQA